VTVVVVIDAPEGLPTVRLEASAGGVAPVAVTVGDRAWAPRSAAGHQLVAGTASAR